MAKDSGLELKVGAFVLTAVICLTGFVLSVSDFALFEKGDAYTAVFNYANGLKKGAPVRLAGVDAGHIRTLNIYYDPVERRTRISIGLWITRGVLIPSGSKVLINQLGLLGEKYVEILPGSSNVPLPAGAKLTGEDPVAMESIMAAVGGIAGKLESTLEGVNQRLLTETNARSLQESLKNVAAITAAIRNGEGTLGKLVLDKSVYEDLSRTLSNMALLTGKLNSSEGTIGRFLTDPGVYQNLEELSADLKAHPWKLLYRPRGK
jgi:phospholipid/cholesterol/gamma-HCH transport system substrate-binding protein